MSEPPRPPIPEMDTTEVVQEVANITPDSWTESRDMTWIAGTIMGIVVQLCEQAGDPWNRFGYQMPATDDNGKYLPYADVVTHTGQTYRIEVRKL